MVNHGLATALLFLVIGMLTARGGSRNIRDYGGVGKVAPLLGGFLLIGAMATIAMPGTNSFVSEFMVLIGTFSRYPAWSIVATTGIVSAAVYMLWIYQRTMTGPIRGDAVLGPVDSSTLGGTSGSHRYDPAGHRHETTALATAVPVQSGVRIRFGDLNKREIAVLTPLVVLIIFLGLYPRPVLDVINPTASRTVGESCHSDPQAAVRPLQSSAYSSTLTPSELCP